jgi:hypothetical protein
MTKHVKLQSDRFAAEYPNIANWVRAGGWIEMGPAGLSTSFVRALDEGGMVFEGIAKYPTIDDAFRALDAGIAAWIDEHG